MWKFFPLKVFSQIRIMSRVFKYMIFLLLSFSAHSQVKNLRYRWTKISGPAKYKIMAPDSAVTAVTDLEEGVYQFELKVINSRGLSARDTMVLTVRAPQSGDARSGSRYASGTEANCKRGANPTEI